MCEDKDYIDKAQKDFFDNYITRREVNVILKSDDGFIGRGYLTKVKIPKGFPRKKGSIYLGEYMYSKKEVYDIKKHNDFILENCMSTKDAVKYLDISESTFRQDVKEFNIESKKRIGVQKDMFYLKDDIEMIKAKRYMGKAQKDFFDNHMTRDEVHEILGLGYNSIDERLTKAKIPDGYPHPKNYIFMFSKKEVYAIRDNNAFVQKNGITTYDAMEYLDVTNRRFSEIIKEFDIEPKEILGCNGKFYLKDDIERIKVKQKEFWVEYISSSEIKKLYNYTNISLVCNGFENYEVPAYARTKTKISEMGGAIGLNCYKRDAIFKKIDNLTRKKKVSDLSGKTYFDTFKLRLGVYADKLSKFNSSVYTKDKWFEFVDSRLNETQHLKTANMNINMFIKITININNALQVYDVSEIYALNSNQVALVYNPAIVSQKVYLYTFLEAVEEDVRLQLLKSREYGTMGFSLDKIEPYVRTKSKVDNDKKEIYDFGAYSRLFKFLSNVELHTKNSLDKMAKDNNILYPSVWLYLMLHLNNAWRKGDAADFPRLHVHDLLSEFDINGLDWFRDNKLTLEQSRRLITRITNNEFRISKTQIKGHFFSSDVLAPAISTVILIIEAFLQSKDILDSNKEYVPLLNFGGKYNQPSNYRLNKFLKDMDGSEDFVFKSKKMNKSVMTYIYHLSNMSGDDDALKYVQKLRNHMDPKSPLHYVDFDLKKIEGLTKKLFRRKEFGYIPSLIIQRLEGKTLSFDEMTEKVVRINNIFNSVFKLDNTIGFMNQVKHERALVIKTLETKSLEECQQLLVKIWTNRLPSKEENVQCLVSEQGCQRPDKKCFNCGYHIPTIYALSSLCKAIIADIREYHKAVNLIKKYKISVHIQGKMLVFQEAIGKFGKEYIYCCLELSEDELLDELMEIPQPEEFYELLTLAKTYVKSVI